MTDPIEEIVSPVRFWQGDIVRTPSGIIALVTSDSNTGVSIAVNLIGPWERGVSDTKCAWFNQEDPADRLTLIERGPYARYAEKKYCPSR